MEEKLTGNLDASDQDLEKINRQLLALLSAGAVITSSIDLQFVLNSVTRQMADLLGVEAVAISELRDNDQLVLLAEYGPDGWWDDYDEPNIYQLEDYPLTQKVLEEPISILLSVSDAGIDPNELAFMENADIKTLLMLPMVYRDRVVGLMEIMNHDEGRHFPEDETTIAQLLANQAASAIENARLFAETERRLQEQAELRKANALVSSSLSLEEVLSNLASQLCQAVNATSTYICDYDPNNKTSRILAEFFSEEATTEERVSFLGAIYQENHDPLMIAGVPEQYHVDDPKLSEKDRNHFKTYGAKSILTLPAQFLGRTYGFAEIWESREKRTFSAAEIQLLQNIAQQSMIAIENARLFAETEKRLKEQAALRKANELLSSSLALDEILTHLAMQLCQAINTTSTYICDYNPKTKTSKVLAEFITDEANPLEKISDLGETHEEGYNQLIVAGVPEQYHVDDPELSDDDREHLLMYGAKSVLVLPAQYLGRTFGFVEIWESRQKRKFSDDEIQLCQNIAQQAMIAIENARLYEQAQDEIAERRRIENALQESQERYALVAQGAKDGIWDWDLKTDEIYFSPRWNALLGLNNAESRDKPAHWFERIHPDDRERVQLEIKSHLEGKTQRLENEYRIRHENGAYLWALSRGIAVRDNKDKAYRMAGSLSDITERKRAEEQLLHDALHDSLTGLPNRALFMDRLDRAIERTKRKPDYLFAVLFLDLDQFKVINDSLGHSVGDLLLIAIARRLLVYLRSVDTVARLGGDEFVVLLEDLDSPEDAINVTERILEEIALPFEIEDHQIFTTVSIGIVMSTAGYDRPDEVLRDADIAMYQAKGQGRATHQVFTSAMRSKAKERLQLENELRRAIGLQEFRIFFQPILDLEDSRVIGFEALVRWEHPQRGLLGPPEFIAVAEETGLIIPIDWWVLRQACQQTKEWQDSFLSNPPISISVNLSGKHFARLDLYDQVVNILEVTGLAPEHLILEITENTIIENTLHATRLISKLRDLKIQVQIDDFGTGYSSLSYLQKYPIDAIKIDRSFISKMSDGGNHAEIVKTIVTFARELGMEAIAEGVETEAQLDQLKTWNCQYGQGYLISKPMDKESAQQMVAATLTPATKNL
jgi:diguanylate cyclase (GGDEF)-like protein/PAS domain S-box-containing protein